MVWHDHGGGGSDSCDCYGSESASDGDLLPNLVIMESKKQL